MPTAHKKTVLRTEKEPTLEGAMPPLQHKEKMQYKAHIPIDWD